MTAILNDCDLPAKILAALARAEPGAASAYQAANEAIATLLRTIPRKSCRDGRSREQWPLVPRQPFRKRSGTCSSLNGGGSSDVPIGGAGVDKLIGEAGDDILTGGSGADEYKIVAPGFGHDVITDFGNGADYIRITGVTGVDDMSDLAFSQVGADALVTFPDGSTLTLEGVQASSLDAGDFSFG